MSAVIQRVKTWLARRLGAPIKLRAYARESGSSGDIAQQHFKQLQPQLVAYDANLLERSRTQWQLGDWSSLTRLDRETLQYHPERAKLALLAAAGQLQSGSTHAAKELVLMAQDWGCSKKMVGQVLISGVYCGLGRAALALGQNRRALGHFKASASTANQRGDNTLWGETVALREGLRLGLLPQAEALLDRPSPKISKPTPLPPETGITSYAQNFEDVMLWRALGRVANGFYIDVGAQDPIVDSVSKAFYEHGWRGVHVEPMPEYASALRHARPDERVHEAVLADEPGEQPFYQISKTGLSTGAAAFAERHRQSGWQVEEAVAPALTLAAVFCESEPREIHWLKVDVEGMEDAVLRGWGNHPARPWIVLIEATEPNSRTPTWHLWEQHLLTRNYIFAYFDGLNRFYVHAEHRELVDAFSVGPNIFDGFRIHHQITDPKNQ